MTQLRITTMALTLALSLCGFARAHKPSDSYLKLHGGEETLTAEWDLALKDLELLVGLDANQNGEITWGELKSQRQEIIAHALSRLQLDYAGAPCELEVVELLVNQHSDGTYAVLKIKTDCPGDAQAIGIHYDLLFDLDPTHRGLVLYDNGQVTSTHVLSPESPSVEILTSESSLWHAFLDYVKEGVWHIWIGFDHILFLLCLLLPAVLFLQNRQWQPVEEFRPAFSSVLKIVTTFTVAHSITLWLAVMEYVMLPSQMVEATIAFSIVLTALNNLYPVLSLPGWLIAFVFGLIHGFGFANVLLDLGLSEVTLALSLLGFNVGVELGQLAIVVVFLPIAYFLRKTSFYRVAVLKLGSVLIASIALIWMYERLFNAEILGF